MADQGQREALGTNGEPHGDMLRWLAQFPRVPLVTVENCCNCRCHAAELADLLEERTAADREGVSMPPITQETALIVFWLLQRGQPMPSELEAAVACAQCRAAHCVVLHSSESAEGLG